VWLCLLSKIFCPSMSIEGELCNGVAYIDWAKLHGRGNLSITDSPMTRCFGRYSKFIQPQSVVDLVAEETKSQVSDSSSKYVRTIGSTAILYLPPRDSVGRRRAVARAVGPVQNDGGASEIGPVEEALVDWSLRYQKDGFEKTVLDPWRALMERSVMVAKRSGTMFISGVFPVHNFVSKMISRVPQLVRETCDLASSVRIEIKIEDHRPPTDDSPGEDK